MSTRCARSQGFESRDDLPRGGAGVVRDGATDQCEGPNIAQKVETAPSPVRQVTSAPNAEGTGPCQLPSWSLSVTLRGPSSSIETSGRPTRSSSLRKTLNSACSRVDLDIIRRAYGSSTTWSPHRRDVCVTRLCSRPRTSCATRRHCAKWPSSPRVLCCKPSARYVRPTGHAGSREQATAARSGL